MYRAWQCLRDELALLIEYRQELIETQKLASLDDKGRYTKMIKETESLIRKVEKEIKACEQNPPKPPLHVPSYPQMSPFWCDLASIVDLISYHVGEWPTGGFGSTWKAANPWYLAGKSNLSHCTSGSWTSILKNAGLIPEECNHISNYMSKKLEYNQWRFGSKCSTSIDFLEFKDYVQDQVWGRCSQYPHPVIMGWKHTRVITGSDSYYIYMSDPGCASFKKIPWGEFKNQIMNVENKVNVETLVFFYPPRNEEEQRGTLWLSEYKDQHEPGSITFCRSGNQPLSHWHWGGNCGHKFGYYFSTALRSECPSHEYLGHSWRTEVNDTIDYQFHIQNITFSDHSYDVDVQLVRGVNDKINLSNANIILTQNHVSTIVAPRTNKKITDHIPIGELNSGLYTLQFILKQDAHVQDIKCIVFNILKKAPHNPSVSST